MRTLLMSIGSRGDMEPFLALGAELQNQGHEVAFCFPVQFEGLAREVSDAFYPQDKALIDLIQGPDIRRIMGQVGPAWTRLGAVLRLMSSIKPIQERLILDQERAVRDFQPDEVIFHIKCIYPVLWALRMGGKVRMLSPMPCLVHPTGAHPHIAFGKPRAPWWNRLTYRFAEYALVHKSILGYGKSFIKKKGWKVRPAEVSSFFRNTLNVEYAYAERLFPRPVEWPEQASISHFRERDKVRQEGLEPALKSFLEQHPRTVYVGFGSMVNAQPKQVAADVMAACETAGVGVILNRSWGGLEPPDEVPSHVYVVDDVPFDGLFPRIQAAIHHGGSGTTHSALRCQLPQAIIPHIADQFFWSRQVVAAGVGVEAFPIKKWSRSRFASVLKSLEPLMK